MRRFNGFSLMEMMIVLLIVAIIAAASAPMVSKKIAKEVTEEGCLWSSVVGGKSIYFDKDNSSVIIGAKNKPAWSGKSAGMTPSETDAPRLSIASGASSSVNSSPYILFANGDGNRSANTIGVYSNSNGSIAISSSALNHYVANTVSLGKGAHTNGQGSIAIGAGATTNPMDAIAIGFGAQVTTDSSGNSTGIIAIGKDTKVSSSGENIIAIGSGLKVDNHHKSNSIIIGSLKNQDFQNTTYANPSTLVGSNITQKAHDVVAFGHNATVDNNSTSIGSSAKTETKAVALGYFSNASSNAIAIGCNTRASSNSIAIGCNVSHNQTFTEKNAVTIGYDASSHTGAVAIGAGAKAKATNAIAIGQDATVENPTGESPTNSVAIGVGATATGPNQIVLGTENSTVYIPGNLVVGGIMAADQGYINKSLVVWTTNGNMGRDASDGYDAWFDRVTYRDGSDDRIKPEDMKKKPAPKLWGEYYDYSDRRLKNVGKAFVGGLEELKKLDLFHYTYKKDPTKTPHVGVMAQDLQKVFPDAVMKGDDGFLRIRMEDMFYALVNAVKELDAKVDEAVLKIKSNFDEIVSIKKRLDAQEKRIQELEKRLEKLEKNK